MIPQSQSNCERIHHKQTETQSNTITAVKLKIKYYGERFEKEKRNTVKYSTKVRAASQPLPLFLLGLRSSVQISWGNKSKERRTCALHAAAQHVPARDVRGRDAVWAPTAHSLSLTHTHTYAHTHILTRIRTHERNFTYNINICITSAEGSFRACISHLSPALSVPMQLLRSPAVNARVVDRSVNNDAWLEIACNGVFHCVQTGSKVEHRGAENCIRCDKSWRTFLVYVCLHPS